MTRLPKHYVLAASISGATAIVQSIIVATVACVLIVQYSSCSDVDATVTPNQYFFRVLKMNYFQDPECLGDLNPELMSADQLRVWLITILAFSLAWLVVSIALIIVVDDAATGYFPAVAFTWGALTAAVTVVDITLAVMLGLDFSKLNSDMASPETPGSALYILDLLRIGTLMLICITLKGIVLPILNIAGAVTQIIMGTKASSLLHTSMHSIHTRGTLNAYESQKRVSNPWHTEQKYEQPFERSGQVNKGYSDIESWRDQPQTNFPSRSFDRSDSWHHSRSPPLPSRPFSYLEEPRSPRSVPQSPVAPPWRRDPWDLPPPVPAPDYSPVSGRRLKSALKSSVM